MLEKIKTTFSEEIINKEKIVIVMFYATYCGFCKAFAPIFEEYSLDYDFIFAKSDLTDDDNSLWNIYNIESVPTIIAFKQGKAVARRDAVRSIGLNEDDIKTFIQEIQNNFVNIN